MGVCAGCGVRRSGRGSGWWGGLHRRRWATLRRSRTRLWCRGVNDHDVAADSRIDAAHLPQIRAARAHARAAAWAAGAAPAAGGWLHLDVDATITIDHSDNKQKAAPSWKKTFGHHPLLVFLDRPEIAGGEALAGLLRPGNAGSNTATDHITVLGWALESLPPGYRPNPHDPGGQKIVVRSDSAGATHTFADACRAAGVGYSFGYGVDTRVQVAVEILNTSDGWYPAVEDAGGIREGAWVAEATHLVDLSAWPVGTRLILRKERPHPGAQLRFTDSDGLRVTAFITDTAPGVVPGQLGGLELRHRQHTPGWRTGSARPRPPGCTTCPATGPTPTRHGWKSSWPQQIWCPGPNRSDSKTNRIWPRARSTPSDTESLTRLTFGFDCGAWVFGAAPLTRCTVAGRAGDVAVGVALHRFGSQRHR